MPDYQKGKIYKIWDNGYNKCYIGSTCESLSRRMAGHRSDYKRYKDGNTNFTSVYVLFEEYGIGNCKIELVELYPSNTKDELLAREGHYQRHNDCLNKRIAGRDMKQYYEDNKNTLLPRQKEYYEEHKDNINQIRQEYRENNRDKISKQNKELRLNNLERYKEYDKQSYERRKDKILAYQKAYRKENESKLKETEQCECGGCYIKQKRKRHEQSKKHQQYLNSLNQQEAEPVN